MKHILMTVSLLLLCFSPTAASAHRISRCDLLSTPENEYPTCTFSCEEGDILTVHAETTNPDRQWPRVRLVCGGQDFYCQEFMQCTYTSTTPVASGSTGTCYADTVSVKGYCEAKHTPACSDKSDNDGDSWTDYPDDPGCDSPADETEGPNPACSDGVDNDGDGATDHPADGGCSDLRDTSERALGRPCDDGIDNDGDGVTDYPQDAGCSSASDGSERGTIACDDGMDNDGDGGLDFPADSGCSGHTDGSERGSAVCDDGFDNDGDGVADYPSDSGCSGPTDGSERGLSACDDGTDNDGDGRGDYPSDPGCSGPADTSERGSTACDDGADNDGDGSGDYPADPGCSGPADSSERGSAACDDGTDNDGDGLGDYPSDPGCSGPADTSERGSAACDDGMDNDGDGNVDYPADIGCTGATDGSEGGNCPELAPSTVVCLEPTREIPLPPLFAVEVGQGDPHVVRAYVEVYRFPLVGGPSVSITCVRLSLDDGGPNGCAEAGGTYVTTLAELSTQPVHEPTATTTPAPAPVRLCHAELTATVLSVGINSAPAITVC